MPISPRGSRALAEEASAMVMRATEETMVKLVMKQKQMELADAMKRRKL